MKLKELIKLSPNYLQYQNGETEYFTFNVTANKTMKDRAGNVIYTESVPVIVKIDKFKDCEKHQIYRDVGQWCVGNSHKCYESLDLLLEDFIVNQVDYIPLKKKQDS